MFSETDANDPYYREDPGEGLRWVSVYEFDLDKRFHAWKPWRTNDGRVLPNNRSYFSRIENPFGHGHVLLLTTNFNPGFSGRSFGGFGMRSPIEPALSIRERTFIEFDFYYPKSAADKYRCFEFWSTSSGGEGSQAASGAVGINKTAVYIRTGNLDGVFNFNLNFRCGFYKTDTWFKKTLCAEVPLTSGNWEYLNLDLLTEEDAKIDNGLLMIGNIRVTQPAPDSKAIPFVVNAKSFLEVEPIRKKYNPVNGYFFTGVNGTGKVEPETIRGRHFSIFVDENNLKPEIHINPPKWLQDEYSNFPFIISEGGSEWKLPTDHYLGIRDSGVKTAGGEYKSHGHTLSWCGQSPMWLKQIVPENITSMEFNPLGRFYSDGVNAEGPFLKVKKDTARRIYFNHVMHIMRHFMTEDERYGSDKKRGVIPFYSFDVINAEIHESRHSVIIQDNQDEWKTALKQVSWLIAMTDDDYADIRRHYVYLLFKYAHIAVPNASMAEKFKAFYDDPNAVPAYMKLDNNDDNGSIDAFVNENPPLLICNDNDFSVFSKAKVAYNMIREINAAWITDPLYDGRNLIECIGIQGHEMVSPTLASNSQAAMSLFAGLIDEGLLDKICYSELNLKQSDSAPGGGALAPDALNQKQADCIGYQYALLFKMFEKYKKYIDYIIFWGQFGASWQNGYVLFDHEKKASQAYYGIMDPDRFIKGHSYLDKYFDGEYDRINNSKI